MTLTLAAPPASLLRVPPRLPDWALEDLDSMNDALMLDLRMLPTRADVDEPAPGPARRAPAPAVAILLAKLPDALNECS